MAETDRPAQIVKLRERFGVALLALSAELRRRGARRGLTGTVEADEAAMLFNAYMAAADLPISTNDLVERTPA